VPSKQQTDYLSRSFERIACFERQGKISFYEREITLIYFSAKTQRRQVVPKPFAPLRLGVFAGKQRAFRCLTAFPRLNAGFLKDEKVFAKTTKGPGVRFNFVTIAPTEELEVRS